jgi:2'-deoxynucleoside 5'-phosphate N-hydrolase
MDIFFSASIRGGRDDVDLYADLVALLEQYGTVLTEHVGTEDVESEQADVGLTDGDIHEQDVAWLRQADAVVAEVTTPSLGVGYELGRAIAWETPTLALYRPDGEHELSAMVRGNDAVEVVEYQTLEAVEPVLESFFEQVR